MTVSPESPPKSRFIDYPEMALFTDLYELTMAQGYWRAGIAERESVFHMFFRKNPFLGAFAVAAGLGPLARFLDGLRFTEPDLGYLASLQGNDQRPLFDPEFLRYLGAFELQCDLDAVPEGTVVFAQEPLLRVRGPLIQAQLLESAVLNFINYQTLVATKAARVVLAARGDEVLEFGMRRAHGVDGAMAASRAAFLGGCSATSNLLAGRHFGIPVRGTHGHSWVMSFGSELEAFTAYAQALPNNCVFLVDTYNTLEGVRHAIEVGRRLRLQGHELAGIRLDSGDLAQLSNEARRLLNESGFPKAAIHASNDLDEQVIANLKAQGSAIAFWGVGTRLVSAYGEPALGGIYKMGAIRDPSSLDVDAKGWRYTLKLSEQNVRASTPGVLQVRRFYESALSNGQKPTFEADCIYNLHEIPADAWILVDPQDATRRRVLPASTPHEDLLLPVFRAGTRVMELPPLVESRARALSQVSRLPLPQRRLMNPQPFPLGLEAGLHARKNSMVLKARGFEA